MWGWKLQAKMWKLSGRKTNEMSATCSVSFQAVCLDEHNNINIHWVIICYMIPRKGFMQCLLLQSLLCKTLLEEEQSLIGGNIFEVSGKYSWFNLLGSIAYLVCKTAYCWPVPTALPSLTQHLCFRSVSLLLDLLLSMPIIRF